MSKVRRNSLILFVSFLVLGLILAPKKVFHVLTDNVHYENIEGKSVEGAEEEEFSPRELVIAPLRVSISEKKTPVPAEKPKEVVSAPEIGNNGYPESTIFRQDDSRKPNVASPRSQELSAEEDYGDDPMLPSRLSVPGRHISEKKMVVDSAEPMMMPGEHLLNGRHLTRKFTHVIEDGDTLELIAQRYLWDPDRASDVFQENLALLPSATELPIGVVLTLPERH